MAAYAVTATIHGVRPRPAGRAGRDALDAPTPDVDHDTVDIVGRPLDEVVAERWASVRETWAITTFFLFDPESWR